MIPRAAASATAVQHPLDATRPLKWSWPWFGYYETIPERDPGRILRALDLPNEEDALVVFFDDLGRALVIVRRSSIDLTNARRDAMEASLSTGWDVEVLTQNEYESAQALAMEEFGALRGITNTLALRLIDRGYLDLDDLWIVPPELLCELGGMSRREADGLIEAVQRRMDERDGHR